MSPQRTYYIRLSVKCQWRFVKCQWLFVKCQWLFVKCKLHLDCHSNHCDFPHGHYSEHTTSSTLQHTETHCNTLQHTETHWNTLQHTATHFTDSHCSEYTTFGSELTVKKFCLRNFSSKISQNSIVTICSKLGSERPCEKVYQKSTA